MTQTIRHEIDPILVSDSVDRAVAANEENRIRWSREAQEAQERHRAAVAEGRPWRGHVPEGPGYVDPMIDGWNATQRDHYALVRIIEVVGPGRPTKPFHIVYGSEPDDLTGRWSGGFATLGDARDWFVGQGR